VGFRVQWRPVQRHPVQQHPVPVPVPVRLWAVVDLLERVPESGRHRPEWAVVPDRGYSW
jgi:hypothetical protein